MAISQPISAGVMAHRRTSTGRTKAIDRASKASKKVALPTTRRARRCQRENGMLSSRATSDGASAGASDAREEATQLRGDAVRTFDGCQMPRARNDAQCRLRNRFMKLPRHRDRRRVILLADNDSSRHFEETELRPRVGGPKQSA